MLSGVDWRGVVLSGAVFFPPAWPSRWNLGPLVSQKARVNGLAGPGFAEGSNDDVRLICLSSKVTRRVCKSTLQAESWACLWGVESGVRILAAVADARGTLGDDRKLRPDGGEGSDDFEALVDD